ncbi:uncharacterized protein LOC115890880 [Sitophilus oryzae]|nr:uncharacterized protein LOC115890880 [Sitophilus oryzae]
MFGGDMVLPKCRGKLRKFPVPADINFPAIQPARYAHIGREPNTDQHVRMHHYKQRKDSFDNLKVEREKSNAASNAFAIKYEKHVQMKRLQRAINDRVNEK